MTYKITPRSGIVQDQRRIDHMSEDYLSPKTETLIVLYCIVLYYEALY